MRTISQRTKSILEAAVKEFIKNGAPVSSKILLKKYRFGIKDATIRNELNRLTKEGFLAQLHTSGGRVPTDKGYKYFIEQAADDALDSKKILSGRQHELLDNLKGGRLRDFIDMFSDETKLLGVGHSEKETGIYKSGLDDLFNQLDIEAREDVKEIIGDFEQLDSRIRAMSRKLFDDFTEPHVYIGNQSPITKSRHLSVIIDNYPIRDYKVLIAVIGPKRMDYDKNLKLFRSLHEYGE